MKKDKGELVADIFYYGMITMVIGTGIAFIIVALVKGFVR